MEIRSNANALVPNFVIQRFVERFKDQIPREARISVCPPLTPLWVKDSQGKYVIGTHTLDRSVKTYLNKPDRHIASPAFMFFIDLEPEANWAHRCAYAFVSGVWTSWYDAEWPPEQLLEPINLDAHFSR